MSEPTTANLAALLRAVERLDDRHCCCLEPEPDVYGICQRENCIGRRVRNVQRLFALTRSAAHQHADALREAAELLRSEGLSHHNECEFAATFLDGKAE